VPAVAADRGRSNLLPEGTAAAINAAPIRIQAILVIASDSGESDRSLANYESALKHVLRFKSYRRAGGGSATVAPGGETTVDLGRGGHKVDLWVTSATDEEIVFGVRWFNSQQTLSNTKLTRPRRSHTVVGGAPVENGEGRYAVLLITE